MILTLYYMYATLLQWWRIGVTRKKLSQAITNQSSVVIYQKNRPLEKNDVGDVIFYTEEKLGCTVVPKVTKSLLITSDQLIIRSDFQKKISLNTWLPFSSKIFYPFPKKKHAKIETPNFTVLIQADMKNFTGFDHDQMRVKKTTYDSRYNIVTCYFPSSSRNWACPSRGPPPNTSPSSSAPTWTTSRSWCRASWRIPSRSTKAWRCCGWKVRRDAPNNDSALK